MSVGSFLLFSFSRPFHAFAFDSLPAIEEGSAPWKEASARILPVDGSIAATAPLPPCAFRPSYAAFCAAALRVVTTLPPSFFLPVIMSSVLRKRSRSSLPVRMPSSMASSCVAPYAWETYPVTGAHMGPSL
ncbi:hypothetical protein SFUMM280S_04138 [Streptomyces fumanus]